ncbi:hypothetical protein [Mycolicibacterium thermoresistibile]|uniref:Ferredoxin n=2 Tax=Mycolicibacterium thermoresistibile TaxID=1797 RepID=G7CK16_MYCT3|nr:hypothetical protein [Mycolicibacterium thermoresistibile]EHI11607.1 hypothetical protein KEK_11948 [Mycolicibacterium thermoresistibile ATCC 19527]MCV7187758.1 hypothetical protein [Mycolicibacterium thermoresistibile]GAT13497.1 putative uncharacterized protein [Mycolicibacterium thermoresistibile]SNW17141.1 Uncharacterised protein [Mycolicibacterium thermoresistibile]
MTARPDNRLLDAPMRPVTCGTCGARVLARKSSWEQTSVQWNAAAREMCLDQSQVEGHAIPLCPALRTAIETAVVQGLLPVLDDSAPPTTEGEPSRAHHR